MVRLCSNSLVRQKILRDFEIPFIIGENGFDEESLSENDALKFAYFAALGKHKEALNIYGLQMPLLIVDSVVSCIGALQRKAKSKDEARAFLNAQSGREFSVISCAILHLEQFYLMDMSETKYKLKSFDKDCVESYLNSNAWEGKAGAVMVEGFHKDYILEQIGSTYNAMGLHIEALLPFLKAIK